MLNWTRDHNGDWLGYFNGYTVFKQQTGEGPNGDIIYTYTVTKDGSRFATTSWNFVKRTLYMSTQMSLDFRKKK